MMNPVQYIGYRTNNYGKDQVCLIDNIAMSRYKYSVRMSRYHLLESLYIKERRTEMKKMTALTMLSVLALSAPPIPAGMRALAAAHRGTRAMDQTLHRFFPVKSSPRPICKTPARVGSFLPANSSTRTGQSSLPIPHSASFPETRTSLEVSVAARESNMRKSGRSAGACLRLVFFPWATIFHCWGEQASASGKTGPMLLKPLPAR